MTRFIFSRFAILAVLPLACSGCAVVSSTATLATTTIGVATTAGSLAASGAGMVTGAGVSAAKAGANLASSPLPPVAQAAR